MWPIVLGGFRSSVHLLWPGCCMLARTGRREGQGQRQRQGRVEDSSAPQPRRSLPLDAGCLQKCVVMDLEPRTSARGAYGRSAWCSTYCLSVRWMRACEGSVPRKRGHSAVLLYTWSNMQLHAAHRLSFMDTLMFRQTSTNTAISHWHDNLRRRRTIHMLARQPLCCNFTGPGTGTMTGHLPGHTIHLPSLPAIQLFQLFIRVCQYIPL